MANTFAGGRLNREGIYRHLGFPDHVLRAGHYAVAHGCQKEQAAASSSATC